MFSPSFETLERVVFTRDVPLSLFQNCHQSRDPPSVLTAAGVLSEQVFAFYRVFRANVSWAATVKSWMSSTHPEFAPNSIALEG